MTTLHWALAAAATAILVGLAALLGFTVYRMVVGGKTVSGYMKDAPRWVVALVSFGAGLVCGILGAHWWFPTTGG